MSPTVSVITSVFNGEQYLQKSIDSILNQTFEDFEFLIVDDGSTDKTPEILSNIKDGRVKIFKNEENVGLINSLNRGLSLAEGKYIARQDADDISVKTRLEEQVEFLESHPDIALVGTEAFHIDEDGRPIRRIKLSSEPEEIKQQILIQNCFYHGSVMFRRECIEEIGNYRHQFRYVEDYDLWMRFVDKYKTANIPKPLYHWRHTADGVTSSHKLEQAKQLSLVRQRGYWRRKGGNEERPCSPKERYAIIVPTCDRPEELDRLIKSVNIDEGDKFFIVNDGTPKKTRVNAADIEFIEHNKPYYARASAINHGIKEALNQGFERGIIFDDDMIAEEDCIDRHKCNWRGNNVIHKGQVLHSGHGFEKTKSTKIYDRFFASFFHRMPIPVVLKYNENNKEIIKQLFHQLFQYGGTTNCSFSLPDIYRAGGFNEDFDGNWGFEDSELYSRLILKHDWSVVLIGDAVVGHHQEDSMVLNKANQELWESLLKEYGEARKHLEGG